MPSKDGIERLLNPQEITRLGQLAIGSRFVVEGALAGAHRSPLKGFSVEFADHRQYVAGDDLRTLDWRVFGRNERLYIRQYEEETSLRVHLLVDASRSMAYASKDISKYQFACRCAACLAYVVIHRQDNIGLALFDQKCRILLPPRGGAEHLRLLCNTMADRQPAEQSNFSNALHQLAEKFNKRGLVILFSDLFEDLENLRSVLAHFRRKRHDVIVYQILDREELDFSFRDIGAFEDLESGEKIITNPKDIRAEYQYALQNFLTSCRGVCAELDVEYLLALSDEPILDLILRHLHQRSISGR
ncbi:MAG: DUF58 domain-containing protein [Lentisphaeria bacterium]